MQDHFLTDIPISLNTINYNRVDFKKVIKLPNFIKGIERIDAGILKGYHIALLCTEKNSLDCHRRLLVECLQRRWNDFEIIHLSQPQKRHIPPECYAL